MGKGGIKERMKGITFSSSTVGTCRILHNMEKEHSTKVGAP